MFLTIECDCSEEKYPHDEVREESSEPDDLARGVETLGDDAVDTDPCEGQAPKKFPLNSSKTMLYTFIHLQDTVSKEQSHMKIYRTNEFCLQLRKCP